MNAADPFEIPPRRWPVMLWIAGTSLLFPFVLTLSAVIIAENVFGDKEPVFVMMGAILAGLLVAVCGFTMLAAVAWIYPHARPLRIVLILLTTLELLAIPLSGVAGHFLDW